MMSVEAFTNEACHEENILIIKQNGDIFSHFTLENLELFANEYNNVLLTYGIRSSFY